MASSYEPGRTTPAVATPLLSVPLKTTDEVDWVGPLKNYIRMTSGDPDKFSEECSTLQRLRQDTRGAGKDTTGRDLLYRYYGQLELLDLRFPIDENNVRISFVWYDAFSKKAISQYSLAYEKASIIFNIAATLSCIATALDRSDSDGLKRAFHSLQASAGMFMYINDNFLHAPSQDLSRETVKLLSGIMLAQAQECVCQTQMRDGKQGKTVAKLANQASMLYGSTLEGINDQINQGIFERFWLTFFQVKQKLFLAAAHYHQAIDDTKEDHVGRAVSRLNVAEAAAKEALRTIPYISAYSTTIPSDSITILNETVKALVSILAADKEAAVKENDFIYHQVIPSEAQLPAIGKLSLAKPTFVTELYKPEEVQRIIGGDLFVKLVPVSVTQSESLYSEEKAKMLRADQEKADLADGELVAALDHLQLPGSLKRFSETKEDVLTELRKPNSVARELAREISAAERGERTANLVGKLQVLRTKAKDGISNSLRQLDEEGRECENMRAKFGSEWTQTPSTALTASMRQELNAHNDTLSQAQNNDDLLEAQWLRYRSDIEILAGGEDGLSLREEFRTIGAAKAAPDGEASLLDLVDEEGPAKSDRVTKYVKKVEKGLGGLNVIKRERQTTLKQLRDAVHNDDISNVLILNRKNPNIEAQVFTSELEKFRPYQTRLEGLIHKQKELLQEVITSFKKLLSEQTGSKEQSDIETAHQQVDALNARFRAARGGWEDVREGAEKGIHFYTALNDLLTPLLERVNKYIVDRRSEGRTLFNSIQNEKPMRDQERLREDLSRLTLDYGNRPPPPLPPQPQPPSRSSSTYAYPSPSSTSPPPQALPTYSYPGTSPPPRPPPPQSPQGYTSPHSYGPPQGYPSQPPQPYAPSPSSSYPAAYGYQSPQYQQPQQSWTGPPPLQPKPGQTGWPQQGGGQSRPPPPPPPPPQGQSGYGYHSPY